MGCDIHFYVETKDDNGEWKIVQEDPNELDSIYDDETDSEITIPDFRWRFNRDYYVFGILANVRLHIKCKYTARGLPADLSQQIKFLSDYRGSGLHTHSYLSLKELKNIINSPQYRIYHLDDKLYAEYKKTKRIGITVSDTEGWKIISNKQMDLFIENYAFSNNEKYLTPVKIKIEDQTWRNKLEEFYNRVLSKVSEKESRVVFWFDN